MRIFTPDSPLLEDAKIFDFALFQGDLLLALSERGLVRIDLDAR